MKTFTYDKFQVFEYQCAVCLKYFKRKGDLDIHSKVHTGERPYPCRNYGCSQAFKTSSNRMRHERSCPTKSSLNNYVSM